ncbi:MAG: hypothetical protein WBE86_05085 [Candidatus Acidiferrales bacterium]
MNRDRRQVVVVAGALAGFAPLVPRISEALRIPETILLIAVAIAEVCLIARMYVISRRACRANAKSS